MVELCAREWEDTAPCCVSRLPSTLPGTCSSSPRSEQRREETDLPGSKLHQPRSAQCQGNGCAARLQVGDADGWGLAKLQRQDDSLPKVKRGLKNKSML